jgi:hypothetical protein
MDVTQLEEHAYIKIAILQGTNSRQCHSELVEDVGNNDLPYRTSPLQYNYFDAGTLF